MTGQRTSLLRWIADSIPRPAMLGRPVRVAVDGVDGSGKTYFAHELALLLDADGSPVVRASVDDFHNMRHIRYRLGQSSPMGYWQDSFDYSRFVNELIVPLGPGGNRRYRTKIHDVHADAPANSPLQTAGENSILLVDGIFLHREILRKYWDFSVYLDVTFDVSYDRMNTRDGSPRDPLDPANKRYLDGQRIYLDTARPRDAATVVVDNNNLAAPFTRRFHQPA